MALEIAFWLLALGAVGGALAVVFLRNVFRAALLLVFCFFCVAGVFITLGADFLAAVQVLIYVGAIGVLLLLAIMLTREVQRGSPFSRWHIPAAILGLGLLAVISWAVLNTAWVARPVALPQPTTWGLGEKLFDLKGGFVLPFEIASLLLLAAIIGAIVMVREK